MFRFLQNLFNYGPTPEESLVGFFPDMDAATEWARGVLAETGTDPEAEFVRAVKDVRVANPRIGLAAAAHLVKQLI
ncbi:hypothetical protein HMPREF3170_09100 [Corynebacterium sp. HMSC08D02]|uniref:hypothetical protein n=1 Tax=Corynebacterium sp. HMSC08D02 TaxID=1581138 RepID=UPI0008A2AF21|nr:hypothetical protein [Corynebacterium sp. HMSC08D02]OFT28473.1 hypothetical protein HMPREF3170_09100 [Corynebacterium sp. HMSC08D02]